MSALSSHPELGILLADVKDQPDDDTPRLILADWLQDQGDPRGELIHLQVVRAGLTLDDPRHDELLRRERQILRRHALDWLGPLADLAAGWEFSRGFIRLRARCRNFLVPAVFDLATDDRFLWVEGLALTNLLPEHVGWLADSPLLARLVHLDLSDNNLGDGGLARLLEARDSVTLHTLRLARTGIGGRGVVALARCPRLCYLRVLDLRRNRWVDEAGGVVALAQSPYLRGLTRLEVSSTGLSLKGLATLHEAFGDRVVLATPW
jgi:uncharacterized protein (TIGR02996 family)